MNNQSLIHFEMYSWMQLLWLYYVNYCTSMHAVWRYRIICYNLHNMLQQYRYVSECLQSGGPCESYWLHSLKESGNRRKEGQSWSFSPVTAFFYAVKSATFSQNAHAAHENKHGQHVVRSFTVQSRPHTCMSTCVQTYMYTYYNTTCTYRHTLYAL